MLLVHYLLSVTMEKNLEHRILHRPLTNSRKASQQVACLCGKQIWKRAKRWKPKKAMGVCAHDVMTAFLKSSIAAPVATCRTGGRWRLKSTRRTGKRRSGELVSERQNGASMSPKFRRYVSSLSIRRRARPLQSSKYFLATNLLGKYNCCKCF